MCACLRKGGRKKPVDVVFKSLWLSLLSLDSQGLLTVHATTPVKMK